MIPVFFGVTVLMFVLTTVIPGDPLALRLGEKAVDPQRLEILRHAYGLDRPLYVQYWRYLSDLFHGDLGQSYIQNRSVLDVLKDFYPNTVKLALVAIGLEILIGVGAGIISAIKRYSFLDVLVTLSTSILVSLPVFWLGMMMQVLFGINFKNWGLPYLPISGMNGPQPTWMYYIMPSIVLASVSTAYAARIMRSQLMEVMGADYIRTATAKGLTRRAVIWRHAMRNALIPVVTFIAIDFGVMLSGAILTETIFNWPGIGYEIYRSITQRDWPVVMGGTTLLVFVFLIINLLVDISYAVLDPRIRYGTSGE